MFLVQKDGLKYNYWKITCRSIIIIKMQKYWENERWAMLKRTYAIWLPYSLYVQDHSIDGKYQGDRLIRRVMRNKESILNDYTPLEKMVLGYRQ